MSKQSRLNKEKAAREKANAQGQPQDSGRSQRQQPEGDNFASSGNRQSQSDRSGDSSTGNMRSDSASGRSQR